MPSKSQLKTGRLALVKPLAVALIVLGLGTLAVFGLPKTNKKPGLTCSGKPCNVILIVADTLAAKHMSLYGYERETTPFLDEFFGKEGIVFENAWSNASWTVPSFISFFTSRLPSDAYVERIEDSLSESIPTFLDILRDEGVQLQYFHVTPFLLANRGVLEEFSPEERVGTLDPLLVYAAGDWIRAQEEGSNKKPYFALIHTYLVHDPYDPPEKYRTLFDGPVQYPGPVFDGTMFQAMRQPGGPTAAQVERYTRQYDQEIRFLDDVLKDFFSDLPPSTLDNSIVILMADHGEGFWEHGRFLHGNSVYEELTHVPFLLRVPGAPSRRISEPMSLIDLAPTLLDLHGTDRPPSFQGKSLLSVLKGDPLDEQRPQAESTDVQWPGKQEFATLQTVVRTARIDIPRDRAIRVGPWKLISTLTGQLEFYNLETDPAEKNNLLSRWQQLSEPDRNKTADLFEALDVPSPKLQSE